jgi:hypothetical protein
MGEAFDEAKTELIRMQDAARSRPKEQTFFEEPAIDALLGVLMALATEHYVLRDRVRILEEQLIVAGQIDPSELSATPTPAERVSNQEDASAFVADLLRPLLGIQESAGSSESLSLKKPTNG